MRKYSVLVVLTLAMLVALPAMADTFTLNSASVSAYQSGNNGLAIRTSFLPGAIGATFDLNPGDHVTIPLLYIYTPEPWVLPNDYNEQPIALNFTFMPPSADPQQATGVTGGWGFFGWGGGYVDWNNPAIVNFGDGGVYAVSLSNVNFGLGSSNGANVMMTVDYRTAPVPEPGTLALLGSGIFGVAGVLRRRLRL